MADRIGVWPAWSGPLWARLKTPLIVIGGIALFIVLIAWLRASNQKRLEDLQQYCMEQGWTFSLNDTLGLKDRVEQIFYDRKFEPSCIRTVETGNRAIYLFDCWHKHKNAAVRVREHRATCCLIESGQFRPVMEPLVITEYLLINETLLGEVLTLNDSPFSRKFVVHARAPNDARQTLTPALQAIILQYKEKFSDTYLHIAIGSSGAVLMTEETLDHDRWQDIIALALAIETTVFSKLLHGE